VSSSEHNGRIYVSFGERDTQEVLLETASKMLTAWAASSPGAFGRALAAVVTAELEEQKAAREQASAGSQDGDG